MESLINRMTALHRSLKITPARHGADPRLAAVVAACLQELHAIAARSAGQGGRTQCLRLVEGASQKPGDF